MPSSCSSSKRGGTKCTIEMKKRITKQQRSVACSKRRQTVFSKAADLCRFGGARMAVYVTSPAENSGVVYSFSGYSAASEIVDCYLNSKEPPTIQELGFGWELDPSIYASCEDVSELNMIESRVLRMRKEIIARIEKLQKLYQNPSSAGSPSQNPSTSPLDQKPNSLSEPCSQNSLEQLAMLDQNPCASMYGIIAESSSYHQFPYLDQNPNPNCAGSSSDFDSTFLLQNPTSSSFMGLCKTEEANIYGEPCSQLAMFDGPSTSSHDSLSSLMGLCQPEEAEFLLQEDDYRFDVQSLLSDQDMDLLQFYSH